MVEGVAESRRWSCTAMDWYCFTFWFLAASANQVFRFTMVYHGLPLVILSALVILVALPLSIAGDLSHLDRPIWRQIPGASWDMLGTFRNHKKCTCHAPCLLRNLWSYLEVHPQKSQWSRNV